MSVNRSATSIRSELVLPRKLMTSHADAHLLDGPDGRREVAVAGHDDRDVEVPGGLHHVDDELDVEVRLDLAVAVLADVLADDLVVAAAQEVVEVALVLVVGIEAGVGVRAHEVAAGRGRLQQRDVIDVHAGRLGRIEDVRHVHEDGDVLAHADSLGLGVRPAGALALHGGRTFMRCDARQLRRGHGSYADADRPRGSPSAPSGSGPPGRRAGPPRRRCSPCCGPSGGAPRASASVTRSTSCVRVDDQEVDRADVAAGPDRRPEREDRATDHARVALRRRRRWPAAGRRAGAEIRGVERAVGTRRIAAAPSLKRDEPIDVRDTGRSDQVLHADGCNLAGLAPVAPDRSSTEGSSPGLALRSSAASDERSRQADGSRPTGVAIGAPMRYDTASLRRPPARRPDAGSEPPPVTHQCPASRGPPEGAASADGGRRATGVRLRSASRVDGQVDSTGDLEEYWMKLHKIGALAAVSVLAFAACSSSGSSAAPSGGGQRWRGRDARRHQQGHGQDRRSSSRSRAARRRRRTRSSTASARREAGRRRGRRLHDHDPGLGRSTTTRSTARTTRRPAPTT